MNSGPHMVIFMKDSMKKRMIQCDVYCLFLFDYGWERNNRWRREEKRRER